MTYEIRKSTTKRLECLGGPAGEHFLFLAVQVAGLLGHDAWRAGEGLVGAWAAIWVEATPPRVNRLKLH